MSDKKYLKQEVKKIVKDIATHYDPLQIIIFGSLVNAQKKECDDIDLVVIKKTNERFLNRSKALVKLIKSDEPIDFFVYTPEEIELAKSQNNLFIINEILKKGKVIFEKGTFYEF